MKLSNIEIHNLKNVQNGKILFKNKQNYLNVTGIYGQNGSGKTTLIDAVQIFLELVQKAQISKNVGDFIGDKEARISLTFDKGEKCYIYEYALQKNEKSEVFVSSESIKFGKTLGKSKPKILFGYQYSTEKEKIEYLSSGSFKSLNLPIYASVRDKKGFIFGSFFEEWVSNKEGVQKYKDLQTAYNLIKGVAFNIVVHTEKMTGFLASGNIMPLSFALTEKNIRKHSAGNIAVSLKDYDANNANAIYYPRPVADLVEKIFNKISITIEKIIPGLSIVVKKHERTTENGSSDEFQIEVLTKRNNKLIPLRAESLGIQKLISVLALLSETFNNRNQIVFIDELDAGIFEFLLGQLVAIMSEDAKGQLIFTSHNLRVLEELPDEKIYFSTDNPQDRYVKFGESLRESNNLRNKYLRVLSLGGENPTEKSHERLYKPTNPADIKEALRHSGIDDQSNEYSGFDFGFD